MKICTKCKIEKDESEFYKDKSRKDGLCSQCKKCRNEYHKQYQEEHKAACAACCKRYRLKHEEEIREYNKGYNQLPENKEKRNIRLNKRKRIDPVFKLRYRISAAICEALKRNQGGKLGISCMKSLSYTVQQLKDHLESQFETWMNWDNYGVVNFEKDTWQIDHIIPHSSFYYETMDCEEFRKCWALENLRPLKSIDNIKKGNKILLATGSINV
jgi:hypothetical protein